jgi:DNA (cytosine-5)-methyltransferase 1
MSAAAPTFLSVFTGIGGFDLGLERSGWRCAGQIEVDPFCTRVLTRHWPNVPRWGDVRAVRADQSTGGARLSPPVVSTSTDSDVHGTAGGPRDLGTIDLLCGGFPCQDLSTAGRRAGLSAARSGLFFEFVRLAGELRPRWLLLENVPGLFSSNGGRDFALILHTLDQLGYGVSWRVLDSRYFGVPQRRRRVFLVGHLGAACPVEVLFEPEGGERDTAPGGEAGESVAYGLAASAGGTGDGYGNDWNIAYALIARQTRLAGEDTFIPIYGLELAHQGSGGNVGCASPRSPFRTLDTNGPPGIIGTLGASNTRHTSGLKSEAAGVAYQCQGTNVGPMGALRRGNGNETGGVPFVLSGVSLSDTGLLQAFAATLEQYANATEAGPDQVLRLLREAVTSQDAAERAARKLAPFWPPEVLRSEVHGGSVRRQGQHDGSVEHDPLPREAVGSEGAVLPVRQAASTRRASPGRGSHEQRPGEPRADLPLLPQPRASGSSTLRDLWGTAEGSRLLQQALHSLEETRRSSSLQGSTANDVLRMREVSPQQGAVRDALHEAEARATADVARSSQSNTSKGDSGVSPTLIRRLTPL